MYTGGFNRVASELGIEGIPSFAALLLGDLALATDVPELLGIPREQLDTWTPRRPERYRRGARVCATPARSTHSFRLHYPSE